MAKLATSLGITDWKAHAVSLRSKKVKDSIGLEVSEEVTSDDVSVRSSSEEEPPLMVAGST